MNRLANYIDFDALKGVFVEYCADVRCRLHEDRVPMLVDPHEELIRIDIKNRNECQLEVGMIYSGRRAQYSASFCTIYGLTRAQYGYHQALPLRKILRHALMVLPNDGNCPYDKGTKIVVTLNGCLILSLGQC